MSETTQAKKKIFVKKQILELLKNIHVVHQMSLSTSVWGGHRNHSCALRKPNLNRQFLIALHANIMDSHCCWYVLHLSVGGKRKYGRFIGKSHTLESFCFNEVENMMY